MLATTIHKSNTTPHHQDGATTETPHQETNASHQKAGTHPTRGKPAGLLPQDPTVCLAAPQTPPPTRGSSRSWSKRFVCCCTRPPPTTGERGHPTNRLNHRTPTPCGRQPGLVVLLRKEVIQPHLPVRLPCYDFVPIADPTFDGSLHKG